MYQDFEETFRESLVKLYKEIWKEPPWNEDFWTDEMVNEDIDFAKAQRSFIGKLALDENEVIGFTWGYELPLPKFPFLSGIPGDIVYIDELAVDKRCRRMGIGTELTNVLTSEARRNGYDTLMLRTDVNGPAYIFYLKNGFTDTGIRDPEYPERTYMKKTV